LENSKKESRMTAKNMTIRMDPVLRASAEQVLDSMGLTFSAAVTLFIKALIREGRIPFEIKADPFYSPANQAQLERVFADVDAGRNLVKKTLAELDALEAGENA
jgi:DNA-damage-inducible protein J